MDTRQETPIIHQLPEEILLEIFECMDSVTLRAATEVCKSWGDLIVHNPKTMKRFKLKLTADKDKSSNIGINDLAQSKRNYQNAIVSGIKFDEVAVNMMMHLGPSLKTLELLNVKVKGLSTEFFAPLVNLEQLTLKSCEFERYTSFKLQNLKVRNLTKLKSVVIEKSNWSLLDLCQCSQLEMLHLLNGDSFDILVEEILDFLSKQKKLKELVLNRIHALNWPSSTDLKMKTIALPLKKLSLINLRNFMKSDESVTGFMKRNCRQLEELTISSDLGFAEIYFSSIFNDLAELQVLDVDARHAPHNATFYQTQNQNVSVKKLIIRYFNHAFRLTRAELRLEFFENNHGEFDFLDEFEERRAQELRTTIPSHQIALNGLLTNLPSLETLIVYGQCYNQSLISISDTLQNLGQLEIRFSDENLFNDVSIPSLKGIHFNWASNLCDIDWQEVARAVPNVDTIWLGDGMQVKTEILELVTSALMNINTLYLGRNFKAEKSKFELIFNNCKNIIVVYLHESIKSKETDELIREFKKVHYAPESKFNF